MDVTDGQKFHQKHNIDDLEDNDEHWLWTHVNRIKRSIHNVLESSNDHITKRIKRGWFDWEPAAKDDESEKKSSWPWDVSAPDDGESKTEDPKTERSAIETETDDIDNDVDEDIIAGSGSNEIDTYGVKLERFCK